MKKILFTLLLLGSLSLRAQVNLSGGLVAYYPFNGSFANAAGGGHDGTGMNGVTFGTDQWGTANRAASFDGIDDYISIAASPEITPSGKFSIAYRFQTSATQMQVQFSKSDWTGNGAPNAFQYQVGINGGSLFTSNGLFFATSHNASCVTNPGLASNYAFGSSTGINQWFCVVVTFESGVKKIYMNGSLISTTTVSGTAQNNTIDSCTGGSLRIGAWWQNEPRWYRGLIDEVRIYNRALNAQEADSLCKLRPQEELVINRYAAITGRTGDCTNGFRVDDATGFRTGDTVLMIQMQGAVIDSSNTAAFGQVLAMNGAGNYEYNIVQAVAAQTITLRNQLLKSYDIPGGQVQLVRVPSFSNYSVDQPHTCMPWNGTKGGVFAIRVAGALTLNAGISVNGAGFRGGQALLNPIASCNKTDYFYPPNNNEGGQKGEGIAVVSPGKRYGRGALANGGGGGNDHNAGGAGGGTWAMGGNGGEQFKLGPCAVTADIGGRAGNLTTTDRTGRMLLGGGGGAGHGNERGEKSGGAGGGIVILDAAVINGNSQRVSANGADAPQCSGPGNPGGGCMNDGGGGGGAGGQILVTAPAINASLLLDARGGKGSDVFVGNGVTASGPGGGGAGGGISVMPAASSRTVQSVAAGASGTLPQLSSRHGAQNGSSGVSLSGATIPFATAPWASTAVKPSYRDSVSGCFTRQFFNTTIPKIAGPTQASWSIAGVGTSAEQNPDFTFPAYGTYELVLWVTDVNGCRDSIRRSIVISEPFGTRTDSTVCAGGALVLTARDGISFVWSPSSDLSSPTTRSVLLTDVPRNTPSFRSYRVSVVIGPGCAVTDTFNISINPAPFSGYGFRPNPPQPNKPVAFTNDSRNAVSYLWLFGDGSSSGEENPAHLFMKTGTFDVCLIARSDKECPDTSCRSIAAEFYQVVNVATGFSPNGDGNNDLLTVKGGPFAQLSFAVFNRWGQRVFETTNPLSGWDGNFRGAPQPVDVYPWVVSVTFMDGTKETIKGNVTLLR